MWTCAGSSNRPLTRSIDRTLSNLSPFHIGFLSLILSVLSSAFAGRLVATELSFSLSLIPLALVIGCGYAYLGWQWHAPLSSRSRIVRMLL
jgi:cadmium resistance protein CadD (predicted permease)